MNNTYQYLNNLVATSFEYCQEVVGVRPSATLQLLDTADWSQIQNELSLPESAQGIYSSDTDAAYVKQASPYLESIIFHEFFGHAVYHKRSRDTPGLTHNLDSEGFSLFMEQKLCELHGLSDQYIMRQSAMSKTEKELVDLFTYSEKQLTTKGLLAQLGFDISFNKEDVSQILSKAYGHNAPRVFEYSQDQKLQIHIPQNVSPISLHWVDIYSTS